MFHHKITVENTFVNWGINLIKIEKQGQLNNASFIVMLVKSACRATSANCCTCNSNTTNIFIAFFLFVQNHTVLIFMTHKLNRSLSSFYRLANSLHFYSINNHYKRTCHEQKTQSFAASDGTCRFAGIANNFQYCNGATPGAAKTTAAAYSAE